MSYLFFTERGRATRDEILPLLDELEHEVGAMGIRVTRALRAADTGWRVVNDALAHRQATSRAPGPS